MKNSSQVYDSVAMQYCLPYHVMRRASFHRSLNRETMEEMQATVRSSGEERSLSVRNIAGLSHEKTAATHRIMACGLGSVAALNYIPLCTITPDDMDGIACKASSAFVYKAVRHQVHRTDAASDIEHHEPEWHLTSGYETGGS